MKGNEMSNPTPNVKLLSWTRFPLETVYSVWEASKTEKPLRSPQDIFEQVEVEEVVKLFKAVIAQHIPIGEHIDLVYMLSNVSVSWREQAVRHRIGTHPAPERLATDIVNDIVMVDEIPDLADSSWWSQSMRIMDMSAFADKGAYRLPDTIARHPNTEVATRFHAAMFTAQNTYKWLVEQGVPMEDARELIGLGAHHRISWKLNVSSLQHIVGKRGCWILQLGLWGPVIRGMITEAVENIDPVFGELVTPPCLKGDEFTGCVYMEECRRRITGDDALPPCPLHLNYHHAPEGMRGMLPMYLDKLDVPRKASMVDRAEEYRQFWSRDPFSGKRTRR